VGFLFVVGSCFGSRLNHLKKQLRTLHSQVLNYTQKRQPIPERLSQQIVVLQEEYNFFFTGQQAYHDILHQITSTVHPFAIDGSGFQSTMSAKFQRSSSAIEGRNGYLSRLHHCGRGISQQQLRVLTVIHNFDLKRTDGTTAAQRLFGEEFPDLFEWVIAQMGDLPLPRKSYSF
jgi:hypothetical protein